MARRRISRPFRQKATEANQEQTTQAESPPVTSAEATPAYSVFDQQPQPDTLQAWESGPVADSPPSGGGGGDDAMRSAEPAGRESVAGGGGSGGGIRHIAAEPTSTRDGGSKLDVFQSRPQGAANSLPLQESAQATLNVQDEGGRAGSTPDADDLAAKAAGTSTPGDLGRAPETIARAAPPAGFDVGSQALPGSTPDTARGTPDRTSIFDLANRGGVASPMDRSAIASGGGGPPGSTYVETQRNPDGSVTNITYRVETVSTGGNDVGLASEIARNSWRYDDKGGTHTEYKHEDGTSSYLYVSADGSTTITENYDKDGNIVRETITRRTENGSVTEERTKNADGSETVTTTTRDEEGNVTGTTTTTVPAGDSSSNSSSSDGSDDGSGSDDASSDTDTDDDTDDTEPDTEYTQTDRITGGGGVGGPSSQWAAREREAYLGWQAAAKAGSNINPDRMGESLAGSGDAVVIRNTLVDPPDGETRIPPPTIDSDAVLEEMRARVDPYVNPSPDSTQTTPEQPETDPRLYEQKKPDSFSDETEDVASSGPSLADQVLAASDSSSYDSRWDSSTARQPLVPLGESGDSTRGGSDDDLDLD